VVSRRWARWASVAAMGFALQTAVLLLLTARAGLHAPAAMALAVGAAVLHNAAWHDRWTWADRPARGVAARLRRVLALSGVTAAVSVGGGVLLTLFWVNLLALPVLVANGLTVATLGLVNYVAADRGVMR
jgi:putative flippase GtrA